jgi:hypothetical protein
MFLSLPTCQEYVAYGAVQIPAAASFSLFMICAGLTLPRTSGKGALPSILYHET